MMAVHNCRIYGFAGLCYTVLHYQFLVDSQMYLHMLTGGGGY